MAKAIKVDCFAYRISRDGSTDGSCVALRYLDCDNCSFYRKRGTECSTCDNRGTELCKATKCPKNILNRKK